MLTLTHVLQLLLIHKYVLLFPLSVIEGPIVSILGGFLASTGHLNLYAAYFTVVVGDLVGDTIYYSLGRFGGLNFIRKYGRWLWLNEDNLRNLESHFQKHAGKTLVIGKFSHGLGSIVLFGAGLAKMPYRRFLMFNIVSTMAKSLILIIVGYYFGYAYQRIDGYFDKAAYIIVGVVILFGVGYYFATKYIRRYL